MRLEPGLTLTSVLPCLGPAHGLGQVGPRPKSQVCAHADLYACNCSVVEERLLCQQQYKCFIPEDYVAVRTVLSWY